MRCWTSSASFPLPPGLGAGTVGVAEDRKHHKRRTVRVCGRRANGEQTALQLSVIESKLGVSAAELPFPSISFVVAASPTAVFPSPLFKTSRSQPLTFAPFVSTRVGFRTQTAAEYQLRVMCISFYLHTTPLPLPNPCKPPPPPIKPEKFPCKHDSSEFFSPALCQLKSRLIRRCLPVVPRRRCRWGSSISPASLCSCAWGWAVPC